MITKCGNKTYLEKSNEEKRREETKRREEEKKRKEENGRESRKKMRRREKIIVTYQERVCEHIYTRMNNIFYFCRCIKQRFLTLVESGIC